MEPIDPIAAFVAAGNVVTVIPPVDAQDRLVELHLAELRQNGKERLRQNNQRWWSSRLPRRLE
jgi:hypothetical protein